MQCVHVTIQCLTIRYSLLISTDLSCLSDNQTLVHTSAYAHTVTHTHTHTLSLAHNSEKTLSQMHAHTLIHPHTPHTPPSCWAVREEGEGGTGTTPSWRGRGTTSIGTRKTTSGTRIPRTREGVWLQTLGATQRVLAVDTECRSLGRGVGHLLLVRRALGLVGLELSRRT